MKQLKEFVYEPPDQEVVQKVGVPLETKETRDEGYIETVKDLINRYDLIALLCDYLQSIIDENMQGVHISFPPEEYPDVYMAFKRRFPNVTDYKITYDQYRTLCRLRMDLVKRGEY